MTEIDLKALEDDLDRHACNPQQLPSNVPEVKKVPDVEPGDFMRWPGDFPAKH